MLHIWEISGSIKKHMTKNHMHTKWWIFVHVVTLGSFSGALKNTWKQFITILRALWMLCFLCFALYNLPYLVYSIIELSMCFCRFSQRYVCWCMLGRVHGTTLRWLAPLIQGSRSLEVSSGITYTGSSYLELPIGRFFFRWEDCLLGRVVAVGPTARQCLPPHDGDPGRYSKMYTI